MSRSRQNSFFSERDEDFFDQMEDNRPKLSMMGLYEPFSEKNTFNYCDTLKDSLIAAKQSISQIIKNTEDVIYEKYLEKRKDEYAIAQTLLLGELQFNMAVQMQDREQEDEMDINDLEDQEPKKPTGETWIRSKISIEHLQELNIPEYRKSSVAKKRRYIMKRLKTQNILFQNLELQEDDIVEKHDKVSEKTSLTFRHKFIKKKEEAFKTELPQPQNMEIPQEVDDIIERLRVIKQLETKRKEEKEEQEKKEKQKNPSELKKEMKNSKYTYDFDGKLINTKVVKTDKLPPSNYSINYQFSTQEIDRNKLKKMKAQQEEQQQKLLQQQLQQQQQQQQKGKGSFLNLPQTNQANKDDQNLGVSKIQITSKNPFSYDDFTPSQGVTLFYDQRIKEGPRSKEIFDTLANLDQRLKMNDEPLQITRSEYKRLTENGNLNMASTIKNMQDSISNQHGFSALNKPGGGAVNSLLTNRSQSMVDNTLGSQKNILSNSPQGGISILDQQSKNKNQKSYFLSNLNHPHISGKGEKDDFLLSLENSKSKITVKSPGLLTNIIVKEDELPLNSGKGDDKGGASSLKLPAINEKNNLPTKSPVDEFNQSIIKGGGDWGKGNRGVGSVQQGKQIHKPTQKDYRTTLHQFYKLPRERDWGQSFKQNKSSKNILKTHASDGSSSLQPEVEFRGTFYTFNSKFSDTLRSFKA